MSRHIKLKNIQFNLSVCIHTCMYMYMCNWRLTICLVIKVTLMFVDQDKVREHPDCCSHAQCTMYINSTNI